MQQNKKGAFYMCGRWKKFFDKLDKGIKSDNIDDKAKAFAIANNSIYFDDRSDYKTALYEVCKILKPDISDDEIGSKFIDE